MYYRCLALIGMMMVYLTVLFAGAVVYAAGCFIWNLCHKKEHNL